jgi:hypothetical protein
VPNADHLGRSHHWYSPSVLTKISPSNILLRPGGFFACVLTCFVADKAPRLPVQSYFGYPLGLVTVSRTPQPRCCLVRRRENFGGAINVGEQTTGKLILDGLGSIRRSIKRELNGNRLEQHEVCSSCACSGTECSGTLCVSSYFPMRPYLITLYCGNHSYHAVHVGKWGRPGAKPIPARASKQ